MSKILWCDETINPVVGCSKVSGGCQNCYAENMARRLAAMGMEQYQRVTTFKGTIGCDKLKYEGWSGTTYYVPSELEKPFKWKKPRTIFISSMGDLFHESVPFGWVDNLLCCAGMNQQHTFILLTKRAVRMAEYFKSATGSGYKPLKNVFIGVSVEDQITADARIPVLLQMPAAKRFISLEPMIGPVDLSRYYLADKLNNGRYPFPYLEEKNRTKWVDLLDGVILGGESGPKARPLHPEWVRTVRDQCAAAGIPFMFKQWGEWAPYDGASPDVIDDPEISRFLTMEWDNDAWRDVGYPMWCDFQDTIDSDQCTARVGRKAAGNMLDGRTHTDLPWSVKAKKGAEQ